MFYIINSIQHFLLLQAIPLIPGGQLKVAAVPRCATCFQNLPLIPDDFPSLKLYS